MTNTNLKTLPDYLDEDISESEIDCASDLEAQLQTLIPDYSIYVWDLDEETSESIMESYTDIILEEIKGGKQIVDIMIGSTGTSRFEHNYQVVAMKTK